MNSNKKTGVLVILSGFSGVGKGTIVKKLLEIHPDEYSLSISATTRNPRPGENEGEHYFFKTREQFEGMIDAGDLLEYADYCGNYYGTPKSFVDKMLSEGRNVLLEIEQKGAMQIKKIYPDALLLFVTTKSFEALKDRLTGRGTETEEQIKNRLSRALEESVGIENYDYLVINDDLDDCVNEVHKLILNEQLKPLRQTELINQIKEGLTTYLA
ncbi:MAG: guanylate kinase [Lachnospiraceae bacterium]|nr:guanylate kinase [Lachnospiraceae bacterium]